VTTASLPHRSRRVVAEIVQLLTPGYPVLAPDTQVRVHDDVMQFVASQIMALPEFLRVPYRLAITAFALLPIVRYGRPFLALPDDAKHAWLALWSDGKIGATRNFVKLIRGCALLAYYDHPLVRAELVAAPVPGRIGDVPSAAGTSACASSA
jgi:hypothetical protein